MSLINPHFNPFRSHFAFIKSVLGYAIALVITSCLICAVLIGMHDTLIKTDVGKKLKAENALLRRHKPELQEQLAEIETTLKTLNGADNNLYQQLFGSRPADTLTEATSELAKDQVLLADISGFKNTLEDVTRKSEYLVAQSAQSNESFGASIYISRDQAETLRSIPSIQPVDNSTLDLLVSGFGERINPFHKGKYYHPGVDFAAPRSAAVYATAPGKVVTAKRTKVEAGYGNYIDIDHGNGYVTRYAHLDDIKVRRGQFVDKGKVIGTVGSSGGSIAPHLHYEVIKEGEPVNPIRYLLEGLDSDQYNSLSIRNNIQNQSLD
jgi:murein DD-endopeptidase MepM/ murein hydrolase activator NlpD